MRSWILPLLFAIPFSLVLHSAGLGLADWEWWALSLIAGMYAGAERADARE